MISIKRYLMGAIITFVVMLLISLLLGSQLSGWLDSVKAQAGGLSALASLIIDPVVWVLRNALLGAAAAAIVWPLFVVMIAVMFALVVIILGVPAAAEIFSSQPRPDF